MTTALKLITGWILFVTLSHWRVKTDWLEVIVTLLMLAAFIILVCGTLFSFLAWVLNSNEKDARKAGIKVGALIVPLMFFGCATKPDRGILFNKAAVTPLPSPHVCKTPVLNQKCNRAHMSLSSNPPIDVACENPECSFGKPGNTFSLQSWGSTNPTNSPICK